MRTIAPLTTVFLAVFLAACAPLAADPASPLTLPRKVFDDSGARNRTVERTPSWIRSSYGPIGIKDLHHIPRAAYADYRPYARDGRVYVMIHPGYFPFFDEWGVTPITTDYSRGLPAENIIDRVGDTLRGSDVAYQVTFRQEQLTRDLIEYLSREKNLIILVLPRDYREHLTYGFVPGYDEYARYLNELTRGADNILYLESDGHQNGYLRDDDLHLLGTFLDALDVRTLMLGGGFLGKCLDNFAGSLRRRYSHDAIWYVPELTVVSPSDIIPDRGSFLSFWGNLEHQNIKKYLTSILMNRTTREPLQWADRALYPVEGYR